MELHLEKGLELIGNCTKNSPEITDAISFKVLSPYVTYLRPKNDFGDFYSTLGVLPSLH